MLLIIFTQYHVLNIHASIANTTRTMAMEVQQQKKRRYCDCGFETTALSDYHTAEHQKSKRHRQAMTANKMQRHGQLLFQGCSSAQGHNCRGTGAQH